MAVSLFRIGWFFYFFTFRYTSPVIAARLEIEIGIGIGIFSLLFPGPLSKRILDHVDVPGP